MLGKCEQLSYIGIKQETGQLSVRNKDLNTKRALFMNGGCQQYTK